MAAPDLYVITAPEQRTSITHVLTDCSLLLLEHQKVGDMDDHGIQSVLKKTGQSALIEKTCTELVVYATLCDLTSRPKPALVPGVMFTIVYIDIDPEYKKELRGFVQACVTPDCVEPFIAPEDTYSITEIDSFRGEFYTEEDIDPEQQYANAFAELLNHRFPFEFALLLRKNPNYSLFFPARSSPELPVYLGYTTEGALPNRLVPLSDDYYVFLHFNEESPNKFLIDIFNKKPHEFLRDQAFNPRATTHGGYDTTGQRQSRVALPSIKRRNDTLTIDL